MKNLYPKPKGRIHPSPAPPSAAAVAYPSVDALAVLRLLPAAILALTAVLGDEDKEVLAYLITRSINAPAPPAFAGDDRRRRRRGPVGGAAASAAPHRPLFDCGCFECYTSFWSRWDCSPYREVISQAIDAFEEQLASSERDAVGGARARRRERRAAEKAKNSEKEKKNKKKVEEMSLEEEQKAVSVSESCSAAEEKNASEEGTGEEAASCEDKEEVTGSGTELVAVEPPERRRAWPDVMGLLNCRLWSLWGPGP